MKACKLFMPLVLAISIMGLFSVLGCEKTKTEKLTADRDAAESVAGSISINTGGALDQISDLCDLMVPGTSKTFEKRYPKTYYIMNKSYNYGTGIWTVNVERERGTADETPYAYIKRVYSLQFLNAGGFPQQYYITGSDTARTVHFNVVTGSGKHRTRRISQQLDSLYAAWTVTNAHYPVVTINGEYHRAAVDTISGWNRLRTSDHEVHLTFTDITAPRGNQTSYPYFSQAISGSINGTFDANITFLHGEAYSETTLHRNINITLGDGRSIMEIGNSAYKASLTSGELIN